MMAPVKYLLASLLIIFSLIFAGGPELQSVPLDKYVQVFYVSEIRGSDVSGDGSLKKPWQTLRKALARVKNATKDHWVAILVAQGIYDEATIHLKEYVDLFGGYDEKFEQRDVFKYRSVVDGKNVRRLIIGANFSRIDGFVLANGRVRGKGAAIFCDGVSPIISNNILVNNQTLSPVTWNPKYRHEIANDGGAIYAQNGAAPVISHNLFLRNSTEVGRGAAIALDGNCRGEISDNVFIKNVTGLKDPKRSSDGGAISVFRWSSPVIKNNIILNNRAEKRNDSGGLFVALWSSPIIQDNIFVGNYGDDDGGAIFVGGQEHRYDRPLDKMPTSDKFFIEISGNTIIGNANASGNSGAMRFTMEARGRFQKNIVAHNNGIYFQRSEVIISDNIILDNFLFVETREWLKPGVIENNILLGDFRLETEASVNNNWMKKDVSANENPKGFPVFIDDWLNLSIWSANFDPFLNQTTVFFANGKFLKNELKNRIVYAGGNWGVVESNDENFIRVWGNFSRQPDLTILPTYRLVK